MQAAVAAGARYLELDVQLSADGVPVIFHDAELKRVTGCDGLVFEQPWHELRRLRVSETARFGDRFAAEPLPSLVELADWLRAQPGVCLFVELKGESIERFGADEMLRQTMTALEPVSGRCAIISYQSEVLDLARARYGRPIGWVIRRWNDAARAHAEQLAPDYLICNYRKITTPLWPGAWQWFLYEITDPGLALHWWRQGAGLIESMDIGALLADPRLRQGARCHEL